MLSNLNFTTLMKLIVVFKVHLSLSHTHTHTQSLTNGVKTGEASRLVSVTPITDMRHNNSSFMSSKQKYLPHLLIFIVISISSLLLFSLSITTTTTTVRSQLHLPEIGAPPNFTIVVKVLTFNRLNSLSRCLNSLAGAHYDPADAVHLHVYIDHFKLGGAGDIGQSLNLSREILDFVDKFDWRFGDKVVHYRSDNAGLQAQWIEAWWPSSDREFAFVVEDDLELSPLYYRFLKAAIVNYYFNESNFSPSVYGVTLQRPRFVPGKHGNKMQLDGEARLFLYQLVGTWGQLLFPDPWKEFRMWYDTHKAKGSKPYLDGMVTNGWYKKLGEKIWTPWFIKFIHARGYFNIYTNFHHERALSISNRDAGVNYGKTAGPDSHILDEQSLDFDLSQLYPVKDLKWYDFCFRRVFPNRVVRSSSELEPILQTVQKSKSVLLVSLYEVHETVIMNMLCHFERLHIQNYILIGAKSDFLLDLARRGHPVIDAAQFSESSKLSKSINFHDSTLELMEEAFVKAYVIKKSLELGFNTWLVDGNVLPCNDNSFINPFGDSTQDIYLGKNSKLLYIPSSSSSSSKIWDDEFVHSIASTVDSVKKEMGSREYIFFRAFEKLLESRNARFKSVDEMKISVDISTGEADKNLYKFVFWSSETELETVHKLLARFDFWAVDGDSSCAGVYC